MIDFKRIGFNLRTPDLYVLHVNLYTIVYKTWGVGIIPIHYIQILTIVSKHPLASIPWRFHESDLVW